MNVLYISPKSPIPTKDGGSYAMRALLKSLTECAIVDGLIFETDKHPISDANFTSLQAFFRQLNTVKIDTRIQAIPALMHLIRRKNYNISRFSTPEIRNELTKLAQNNYQIVVVDGLFAGAELHFIKSLFKCVVVLRTHNVEHQIWEQKSRQESNLLKRIYLRHLARTLKTREVEIIKNADQIWTISQEDLSFFNQFHPSVSLVPVALEPSVMDVDYSTNHCFHLGAMNWKPNQEAVDFLVQQIWNQHSDLGELYIAGSFSSSLNNFSDSRIRCLGEVDDLNAFYAQGGILVSPIFHGSGIRIKCLEALSMGIPCITTVLGASGISNESGIVIAQHQDEFYQAIVQLQSNAELRATTGQKGKAYIQKMHSFEVVNSLIKQLLGN